MRSAIVSRFRQPPEAACCRHRWQDARRLFWQPGRKNRYRRCDRDALTGYKTRSLFERYNIVSECDLVEAAKKLNDFHGHNLGSATRHIESRLRKSL
jgi:hypothetical protein